MESLNRKRLASIIVIIFILITIPLVVFLVKQQQNLRPKAAQSATGTRINFYDSNNNLITTEDSTGNPVTTSPNVNLKIFYSP